MTTTSPAPQLARLFPETGPDIALDLIDSQAFRRA